MQTPIVDFLTRTAIAVLIAMLAAPAHGAFCAPRTPVPTDAPPPADNPPSGALPECERSNASPCFAKAGVYTTAATDLQIPTNRFPLAVSRSYESSHVLNGAVGIGWRSNLGA